jgi:uncharacterized protein
MIPEKLDDAATVIIGETVRAGCEEAFLAWQQRLNSAASHYPGFIAAEINPPTPSQRHWSLIYRFDSVPNLQAWINSATRQDALADGRRYLECPSTQQIVAGGSAAHPRLRSSVPAHAASCGLPRPRVDSGIDR